MRPAPARTVAFLLLAALLAGEGLAQTYDQLAPKTPPPVPAPTLPAAPDATAVPANHVATLPALKGLVFVADRTALRPQGRDETGVHLESIPELDTPEFRALAAPFLGQTIGVPELDRLAHATVDFLRAHDRPVADVLLPEQNIESGTVQFLVVFGRLGRVRVEGEIRGPAAEVAAAIRTRPGDILSARRLLDDLTWANRNPFRQVDLAFARGEHEGETDIVLRTRARFPLRVFAGYENTGSASTSRDRVLAGFNWGRAFGSDRQFNYQFSASPDLRKFAAHSASYTVPLPTWRHTLTLFGSAALSKPELPGGYFSLRGRSTELGLRYRVPLPQTGATTHSLVAGLDFKRTNNNLAFGGYAVFNGSTDIAQAVLAYSANRPDSHGATSGTLTVALSPGGLTAHNHDSDFAQARSFARAEYALARLELERITNLPAGFSWHSRATAQFASASLLGSEQLGLGGSANLRGYEERELNCDNGLILVNELHAPAMHPVRRSRLRHPDHLDPYVFWDFGVAWNRKRPDGEPGRTTLSSAGAGLRYELSSHVSLQADYGWQLKASGLSAGEHSTRLHVSTVFSF